MQSVTFNALHVNFSDTVANPEGDIALKSDNMLAPVVMYQIKDNIIH